jgi:hypothetical protein
LQDIDLRREKRFPQLAPIFDQDLTAGLPPPLHQAEHVAQFFGTIDHAVIMRNCGTQKIVHLNKQEQRRGGKRPK